MDYDDYSYSDQSYDEDSYGNYSYDDNMSYTDYFEDQDNNDYEEYEQNGYSEDNQSEEYDQGQPENVTSQDDEYQDHNYHDYEPSRDQDNESLLRKSDDWDPYSSDDDVEYIPHHVITNSSTIVEEEKDVNDVKNFAKSPSELAFDRAITVLFNQDINGTIATLFTNIFGRRDISDLINPEISEPSSDFFSHIKSSPLNQSERKDHY